MGKSQQPKDRLIRRRESCRNASTRYRARCKAETDTLEAENAVLAEELRVLLSRVREASMVRDLLKDRVESEEKIMGKLLALSGRMNSITNALIPSVSGTVHAASVSIPRNPKNYSPPPPPHMMTHDTEPEIATALAFMSHIDEGDCAAHGFYSNNLAGHTNHLFEQQQQKERLGHQYSLASSSAPLHTANITNAAPFVQRDDEWSGSDSSPLSGFSGTSPSPLGSMSEWEVPPSASTLGEDEVDVPLFLQPTTTTTTTTTLLSSSENPLATPTYGMGSFPLLL